MLKYILHVCTVLYVHYVIESSAFSSITVFLFICCARARLWLLFLDFHFDHFCYLIPFNSHCLLFLTLKISCSFLQTSLQSSWPPRFPFLVVWIWDHSIYCTFVFSFCRCLSLCPSLSISFLAACLCFMSISIFPSFISVRAQPLMPAATHGKQHIFCHIAMSVKFRSCVCVCMCLRFKGTFIIKFHFLCRQTLLPAGWQTRGNERANECVRARVGVSVCWLHRAGIRMHWLLFSFIFICLFSPPTAEERGVEDNIRIEFFSSIKLLWRGFT